MKAKLTIEGKEFEVEISEEQAKALTETKKKTKKKTGYERVKKGEDYYIQLFDGTAQTRTACDVFSYDHKYESAYCYADRTVAENNARADKLYRQLRRFAVEHREKELDWNDKKTDKWFITFDTETSAIITVYHQIFKGFSIIYFDSEETTQLAIDTFKDELLWYFTEYKDSL